MSRLLREFIRVLSEAKHERCRAVFEQHSLAAQELYAAIYRTVEVALGRPLPPGTPPLEAVKQLAEAYVRMRLSVGGGPASKVARTESIDYSGPQMRRIKIIDDDGQID